MQVDLVAARVPAAVAAEVLDALARALGECAHIEFLLRWVRALCLHHGPALQVRPLNHPLSAIPRAQPSLWHARDMP